MALEIENIINNLTINSYPTIIYARCSSKKQNSEITNSQSLNMQIHNCNQFCHNKQFSNINIITEICSATKIKNQKNLLDIIDTRENINLVIFDISRFSRNIFDGTNLIKQCIEKNIIIYSIKEGLNTETKHGMKLLIGELMNAQNESDSISYRVNESIKFRKSQGIFIGSRLPYGFKYSKFDKRKIVKDESEQNIILLILKLKYGCTFEEMNNLVNLITEHDVVGTYDNEKLILYGNYENSDIAYLLFLNDIYYRGDKWTSMKVYNICKNNGSYISKKDDYTKELIRNLYHGQKLDSIKNLYQNINEFNFDETKNSTLIKNCKKNKSNILTFLNKNNVFYNNWTSIDNIIL